LLLFSKTSRITCAQELSIFLLSNNSAIYLKNIGYSYNRNITYASILVHTNDCEKAQEKNSVQPCFSPGNSLLKEEEYGAYNTWRITSISASVR